MITINGERELVDIASWDDLIRRPHFQQRIDPNTVTLDKLIGTYQLSAPVQCGLSDCRTPHLRGYLAVTKEGLETNIGNVCGKNTFGVDFVDAKRTLQRDMRLKMHREAVRTFQSMLPLHQDELAALRAQPHGIDWAHRRVSWLLDPSRVPDPIRRVFTDMIKTGDPVLRRTREATRDERARMEVAQGPGGEGRHRFVTEDIGLLEGSAAFRPEMDLRKLVALDLEPKMDDIATIDTDTAAAAVLEDAARWVSEFEEKMDRVRRGLAHCRALLTKHNLTQLLSIEITAKEEEEFRRVLADLPEALAVPSIEQGGRA
jgi:hypothetical protein